MIEKKVILLMNVHDLYILELKTSKKIPVRLSVCLLGRLKNFSGCTITSEGVSVSKQNLVGVVYA